MLKTIHDGIEKLHSSYEKKDRPRCLKLSNRLRSYLDELLKNLRFLDIHLASHKVVNLKIELQNALPHFEKDISDLHFYVNDLFVNLEQNQLSLIDKRMDQVMEEIMITHARFKSTFPRDASHLDQIIHVVKRLLDDIKDDYDRLLKEKKIMKDALKSL